MNLPNGLGWPWIILPRFFTHHAPDKNIADLQGSLADTMLFLG
jgi:hypothetical protein